MRRGAGATPKATPKVRRSGLQGEPASARGQVLALLEPVAAASATAGSLPHRAASPAAVTAAAAAAGAAFPSDDAAPVREEATPIPTPSLRRSPRRTVTATAVTGRGGPVAAASTTAGALPPPAAPPAAATAAATTGAAAPLAAAEAPAPGPAPVTATAPAAAALRAPGAGAGNTPKEPSPREKLAAVLAKLGRRRVLIDSDGHCLFSCFAAVSGPDMTARRMRRTLADYLLLIPVNQQREQLVLLNEALDGSREQAAASMKAYAARVCREDPPYWGSEVDASLLANALNWGVAFYVGKGEFCDTVDPPEVPLPTYPGQTIIHLLYLPRHYDLLVGLKDADPPKPPQPPALPRLPAQKSGKQPNAPGASPTGRGVARRAAASAAAVGEWCFAPPGRPSPSRYPPPSPRHCYPPAAPAGASGARGHQSNIIDAFASQSAKTAADAADAVAGVKRTAAAAMLPFRS